MLSGPVTNRRLLLGALFIAALFAWFLCPAPPARPLSWFTLSLAAVRTILFASLAASAAVMIAFKATPQRDRLILARRIVVAVVWFVPLAVFLYQRSPWAAVSATFLVAGVTVLLHAAETEGARQFLPQAMCAALSLQAA